MMVRWYGLYFRIALDRQVLLFTIVISSAVALVFSALFLCAPSAVCRLPKP